MEEGPRCQSFDHFPSFLRLFFEIYSSFSTATAIAGPKTLSMFAH